MVTTKIKPLLPSLREKKRYVVFEVISREMIRDFHFVSDAILNYSFQLLGQYGVAKAGLIILDDKWDRSNQRGIIKVSHRYVDAIKAALVFVDRINNAPAAIRSLGVSGILNKAERKFLKAA